MKMRLWVLTLLLLSGYSVGSYADALGGNSIDAGKLSLGGRATYFKPVDADGNWYGGAQLRWHWSSWFALEGSADYRREDFDSTRVHVYPVQASALFYLIPNSPVTIFALAGAGWYYTTIDNPNSPNETQHRFGPHVGGGVQFFLNRHWSIDGTYRYIWLKDVDTKNLIDAHYSDSGSMVTVALNYHF
jgi:opacity protein-like surface antigen